MNAKDRLIEFLEYKELGQNAFESNIGIARGYVSHVKSSIGSDIMAKIVDSYPELSLEWLITGKGDMLKEQNNQHIGAVSNSNVVGVNLNGDGIHISSNDLADKIVVITEKYQAQIDNLLEIINKVLNKQIV